MTTYLPRLCFGLTLYNNAKYLPEAIESLLNQSYGDFYLIAVDDCSTDGTEELMRQYTAQDQRISYYRNKEWSGLITTWRTAFQKAYTQYQPDYFAWASDHDRWHVDWLRRHVQVLNKHSDVVLAYPQNIPISAESQPLSLPQMPSFETRGLSRVKRLYDVCTERIGAGNAVYGLFRVEPLMKAGIFRRVVLPDRLLLIELSAYGAIEQIPEVLWYRRYFDLPKTKVDLLADQRKKLFGPIIPLHAYSPFISHSLSLLLSLSIWPLDGDYSNFWAGLLLAALNWDGRYERHFEQELTILQEIMASHSNNNSGMLPSRQKLVDETLPEIAPEIRLVIASLLDTYIGEANVANERIASFIRFILARKTLTNVWQKDKEQAITQSGRWQPDSLLNLVTRIKHQLQKIKVQ